MTEDFIFIKIHLEHKMVKILHSALFTFGDFEGASLNWNNLCQPVGESAWQTRASLGRVRVDQSPDGHLTHAIRTQRDQICRSGYLWRWDASPAGSSWASCRAPVHLLLFFLLVGLWGEAKPTITWSVMWLTGLIWSARLARMILIVLNGLNIIFYPS